MNEFSRTFRIDTLGAGVREVEIEANEAERAALAERFALPEIHALSATASLIRAGEAVRATGRVTATVVQSCVGTGEPVEEKVAEDFSIEFRPHPDVGSPDEEIELSGSELDVVFYDGAAVDLGDAVAETVSLALNPFPRSPQAEKALREAGVKSEEDAKREASPFAGLAALKDKLGG
ncbi:MAG TPA: DUF177 domain-containing protein [Allosphingosinicella sp.]|jgi:uncharacterized metal-binding protein YceD (DUF177 family)